MAKYTSRRCRVKLVANALITAGWFAIGTPMFSNLFSNFSAAAITLALLILLVFHIIALAIYDLLEETP